MPKLVAWRVTTPDGQYTLVVGHTKGEARARAKKALGIASKGRLPPGTAVEAQYKVSSGGKTVLVTWATSAGEARLKAARRQEAGVRGKLTAAIA